MKNKKILTLLMLFVVICITICMMFACTSVENKAPSNDENEKDYVEEKDEFEKDYVEEKDESEKDYVEEKDESEKDESEKDEKESSVPTCVVIWKNEDGTILEVDEAVPQGSVPTYNGAMPIKSGNAQYSYEFNGWSPSVEAINSGVTYIAQFKATVKNYTVRWESDDGTLLELDEKVAYGTVPTYDGAIPNKTATAEHTYTFKGWNATVKEVEGDVVYKAEFTSTVNTYTVRWKNEDGTLLETDENVAFGAMPTYDGAEPTKAATEEHIYLFKGWTPAVKAVDGNIVYTAEFEKIALFLFTEVRGGYAIDAYYGNSKKVVFPARYNNQPVVEIGANVLANNSTVLEVVLPDTVKKIGDCSFSNCPRLYKINIPSQCTTIGTYVMAKTDIEEITLPSSVMQLGGLWLYDSSIKTLRLEGSPNCFIGEYFGTISANISLASAPNKLSDHFKRTETYSEQEVWVGSSSMGFYQPKYTYLRWALKDDNRWFQISVDNSFSGQQETIMVFANGASNDYSYQESLVRTEDGVAGTLIYHYDYTLMSGSFYLIPKTLETIEISRNAGVNEELLLGYASDSLTISYYN